uniref:OSJNBb0046K02.4 protein n=1 Tax=Oryza sativa subsp. japonica TaxID=39947 RepID=Q7DNB9_ORYSJ|nr:OSJNBb0046K02.4 [Oryza sativa Japonica Group]
MGVDDKFPKITFNFENDLSLDVYPYDYLLEYEKIPFPNASALIPVVGKSVVTTTDLIQKPHLY